MTSNLKKVKGTAERMLVMCKKHFTPEQLEYLDPDLFFYQEKGVITNDTAIDTPLVHFA